MTISVTILISVDFYVYVTAMVCLVDNANSICYFRHFGKKAYIGRFSSMSVRRQCALSLRQATYWPVLTVAQDS